MLKYQVIDNRKFSSRRPCLVKMFEQIHQAEIHHSSSWLEKIFKISIRQTSKIHHSSTMVRENLEISKSSGIYNSSLYLPWYISIIPSNKTKLTLKNIHKVTMDAHNFFKRKEKNRLTDWLTDWDTYYCWQLTNWFYII